MPIQKTTKRFEKDAVILAEDQPSANDVYYLLRGTALAEVKGNVIGTIKPGEWFGEMAAILGSVRTATVRAITPCEVFAFTGLGDARLFEALTKDPKMTRKLLEQLALRLIETSRRHAAEVTEHAAQAEKYRKAVSGTLHALEKLSEKHHSQVIGEVREHLSTLSGIPMGSAADADPKFFKAGHAAICGD